MTKHGKWALALLFAPFLLKLGGCQSSPDPATSEENATGDGSNGSGLNSSNSLDAEPLDGGDPLSNTINGNGSLNSEAGAGNVKSVQNKSLNSTLFANSNPPPNAPTTNGGPSPAPANSPTPSNSPAPANSLGALPDLPPILGNTPGGNTPSPAANTVRAEPSPTMEVPPLATPPLPGPGHLHLSIRWAFLQKALVLQFKKLNFGRKKPNH